MSPPYDLSIEEIPLLGQIYPHLGHETTEDAFVPYSNPTTTTALDEVAMYLHSSGSTGFPKSIPETHRNLIHYAALEGITQMVELSPRLALRHLPAFHSMAIFTQLLVPILCGGTACMYPLTSIATEYVIPLSPTSENALENAKRANATGILTVPAFILECQSPADIAYLKTLKLVAYGGGPLATRVGDFLFSQGVNLVSMYGATEFGIPTIVTRRQAEVYAGKWAWFRFSSRVNIRWILQGDGALEGQFLTVPSTHQVAVENLPDVRGYSINDLFERHPTKPDLYRIVGRLDDVLIMANGEKTVPGPMEDIMMASPLIMGAIMFGRERNQVGVLIEPNPHYKVDPNDEESIAKYRDQIWPVIEEANESSPAFARIYKEMILVTHAGKPMARAAKGTVIKKATMASYKQEIDELYNTFEASENTTNDVEPPSSWTSKDLEPWIETHASLVVDTDICGGYDLFDQGFDSLNATFLRHRIVGALKNPGEEVAAKRILQNFIYTHPSIEELTSAIAILVHGDADTSEDGQAAVVEKMIVKYSEGFEDDIVHERRCYPSAGMVVLLTGSTAGIGSHILEISSALLRLNLEAFVDRALDTNLLSSAKLVYLEGDTSKADLGLHPDFWSTLRDTLTVIIHNAWTLDFNKTLSSFEPHVKGTRNLIDLARQSTNESGVRFLLTSSISSTQCWDQSLGLFPEELQLNAAVAVESGYGESKYISERILAANGAWSTTDWVPAIVKSSIALGNFPSDPSGEVAWLSPEAVSHAIVEAALSTEKLPFTINLVHPHPVPWDLVMSAIASDMQLPLVPFSDWVEQLQSRSAVATAEDMEKIPGIKLLDFFKAVLAGLFSTKFSTLKTQALSQSMETLKPLTEVDVKQWISYWRQKKFIE
ncbi:hypothetical protein B0H19DRAFT_1266933 [Mycena capillaripes]|nr:hypothetical protein B0H19DRAFT_1266933 [Mycena capillaripes]